ncbi:hypothetical protein FGO68_gene11290 [Halteria grandinella]|uniref:Uncharacterized protein n=1 Tax=Halteria grandinella TaxID=5974 RepID=A0A8J8NIF2_HALGN|nr:hypothetical protein FGO68_gene11290 [Halteria grandinella]
MQSRQNGRQEQRRPDEIEDQQYNYAAFQDERLSQSKRMAREIEVKASNDIILSHHRRLTVLESEQSDSQFALATIQEKLDSTIKRIDELERRSQVQRPRVRNPNNPNGWNLMLDLSSFPKLVKSVFRLPLVLFKQLRLQTKIAMVVVAFICFFFKSEISTGINYAGRACTFVGTSAYDFFSTFSYVLWMLLGGTGFVLGVSAVLYIVNCVSQFFGLNII